jgi:hypothetical protein
MLQLPEQHWLFRVQSMPGDWHCVQAPPVQMPEQH